MTKRITLLVGAALLLGSSAWAYSDADYCRDTVRAQKLLCKAQLLVDQAACNDDLAWMRWAEIPGAFRDARECNAEARDVRAQCEDEAVCEVLP